MRLLHVTDPAVLRKGKPWSGFVCTECYPKVKSATDIVRDVNARDADEREPVCVECGEEDEALAAQSERVHRNGGN